MLLYISVEFHVYKINMFEKLVVVIAGGLRACTYCCGVISDLMEGADDLGALRDNVQAQLSDNNQPTNAYNQSSSQPPTPSRRYKLQAYRNSTKLIMVLLTP